MSIDRLDLRLLEYFVTVAEELHFGRAARRLHIAQPSLSQQIRRLENQLGVTLLERDSRNVELTAAGETLLREGREALRHARWTIQATRAAAGRRLAIGFYGSAATLLLPDLLRRFSARQPSCDVSVRELALGRLDEVLDGRVDLAFTRLRPDQTELECEVLTTEPRLVALARDHPLAARESLHFAELRDERFIVNPVVPHDGPPKRWLAEQQRHGLPGRVGAEAASVQEILALVASGRGACLVPGAVAAQYARADVRYVPVIDAEPALVSLVWRGGSVTREALAFLEMARQLARPAPPPAAQPLASSDVAESGSAPGA